MEKFKKILPIIYVLTLVLGGLYINSVLKEGNLTVGTKSKQTQEEAHPAVAYLDVEDGKSVVTYRVRMETINTVNDLLLQLHDKNGFMFEKISYTSGTVIDLVNGKTAPQGYAWKLFIGDKDITGNIENTDLIDEQHYTLKLLKS